MEWTVAGPVSVDGGTGNQFEFQAPTTGAFAGVYTVTATDAVTQQSDSFHVRVPMTFNPSDLVMIDEDSAAPHTFRVEGAPEGTGLMVFVVSPDEQDVENAADVIGQIELLDEDFDENSRAEFSFAPAWAQLFK